ncbi:unnamed protein product [Haemonchus placei]|uniref:Uncharacterized protein n=1 Tax=Haemonchus placei TaxID=6290 RepID=A0A0N4X2E4_HAEPC|nr:unnamed protein product [Haemonchus placei]
MDLAGICENAHGLATINALISTQSECQSIPTSLPAITTSSPVSVHYWLGIQFFVDPRLPAVVQKGPWAAFTFRSHRISPPVGRNVMCRVFFSFSCHLVFEFLFCLRYMLPRFPRKRRSLAPFSHGNPFLIVSFVLL